MLAIFAVLVWMKSQWSFYEDTRNVFTKQKVSQWNRIEIYFCIGYMVDVALKNSYIKFDMNYSTVFMNAPAIWPIKGFVGNFDKGKAESDRSQPT